MSDNVFIINNTLSYLLFYAEDLTNASYDDVLNAEQLQKLLYLLESTEDPVIIERALVTVGNNAAFSANQVSTLIQTSKTRSFYPDPG